MLFCIKFRTRHAWGYGDWQYVILEREKKEKMRDVVDDWAEGIHDQYSYSDKYRGLEWHHVRKPKPEIIIPKIESAIRSAKYNIEHASDLIEFLTRSK